MTSDLRFLAPCVGVAVIVWWMVEVIRTDPDWWLFSTESLAMTLSQVIFRMITSLSKYSTWYSGQGFCWW